MERGLGSCCLQSSFILLMTAECTRRLPASMNSAKFLLLIDPDSVMTCGLWTDSFGIWAFLTPVHWLQSWIQHSWLCSKLTKSTVSLWPRTHWRHSRPCRRQNQPSWRQCRPRQAVAFKLLPICRQNRQQSRPYQQQSWLYRWQSTSLLICRRFRQQSTL